MNMTFSEWFRKMFIQEASAAINTRPEVYNGEVERIEEDNE